MTRCLVLRYDGRKEIAELDGVEAMAEAIGADYLDFVHLHLDDQALSIAVDDIGLHRKLPVNYAATTLAMVVCKMLGFELGQPLVGDVVVFGLGKGGETLDAPANLLIAAVD